MMFKPLKIGPFALDVPAVEAGLAGYSDMAMRVTARRRGCPYAVTEALLDRVIITGGRGREKGLVLNDEDHPVAGQLLGSEADEMAAAAKILKEYGFDVVDLNFACPVKKVMGRCRGGYLLSDPVQAIAIMRAVRDAIDGPLTLKLRRGLNDSAEASDQFEQIFDEAQQLEFAAIAVHGRTVEQKYTGKADWNFLRLLKARKPRMTVLGSGDVFCAADALNMYESTGVDGVWIARGAIGNPWIFSEFQALISGRSLPPPPTIFEQKAALLEHFQLAVTIYGEELAARQMRKMGIKYSRLHPEGTAVWKDFIDVKSQSDWDRVLTNYYSTDGPGRVQSSIADAADLYNSCSLAGAAA
jgi:tRNA-dihydrouridine synthase B